VFRAGDGDLHDPGECLHPPLPFLRRLFQEVAPAMAEGFRRQFNLTLQSLPLTEWEYNLAGQLRARQYVNDRWKKRI